MAAAYRAVLSNRPLHPCSCPIEGHEARKQVCEMEGEEAYVLCNLTAAAALQRAVLEHTSASSSWQVQAKLATSAGASPGSP